MSGCSNEEVGRLLVLYEMGQLSDEERDRFEEHLLDCDFCRREVEEMQPVMATVQRHRDAILGDLRREGITFESLKQELSASREHSPLFGFLSQNSPRILEKVRRPWVWIPAAGIAAVILFLLLSPLDHGLEHYTSMLSFNKLPFQSLELRGRTATEAEQFFQNGMDAYMRDNYEDAVGHLENAVGITPDNGNWWLYLGVSYYLNHQAEPAIEALTKADSLTEYYSNIRARWYLAQAYLLEGNAEKAAPLLDWVSTQNRIYAESADSLRKAIQ